MIGVIMEFAGDIVEIRVDGTNVWFRNSTFGSQYGKLEHMQLSRQGIITEFPDLANDSQWKSKAIERFNEKIKGMRTEEERVNYIIEDLRKHGYIPKFKQKSGFRPEVIK